MVCWCNGWILFSVCVWNMWMCWCMKNLSRLCVRVWMMIVCVWWICGVIVWLCNVCIVLGWYVLFGICGFIIW